MSELPTGWLMVPIGDVIDTSSGGTPSRTNSLFYNGDIPWVKSGDLNDAVVSVVKESITQQALESSSAKIFPAGTLCIALYGATVGKLGFLGFDAATNQAVCALFCPNGISTKFLFYYLKLKKSELVKLGKGGAQQNISQTVIKEFPLILPPLNEQKRIADKLDQILKEVNSAKAHLDQIPTILKNFRQSVLKSALKGDLTENDRSNEDFGNAFQELENHTKYERKILEKNPKGANAKLLKEKNKYHSNSKHYLSKNDDIPSGWVNASFYLLAVLQRGFDLPKSKRTEGEYPILSSSGVTGSHKDYKTEGLA